VTAVDVVVVGAGAAGLHCAAMAGQRGLAVLLVDHAPKVAEKIRISGGGRCNFTNISVGHENFISANPDFCRSALARYTPRDFIALIERHGIAWHEKHKGQLFCDGSSRELIDALLSECETGGVRRRQPLAVEHIARADGGFEVQTVEGPVRARRLVIATGGLSIPQLGASDFGYRVARQFGHRVVETRPALVPFVFAAPEAERFRALAGLSLPVRGRTRGSAGDADFAEDLLFTHRGLSGPAALQLSSYWQPGRPITLDLVPEHDLVEALLAAKRTSGRRLAAVLPDILPRRLVEIWLTTMEASGDRPIAELRDRELRDLAASLQGWSLTPAGTEGYRKAEVTAGGVDTRQLDSRSCESRLVPGLYFIGEVVDVTGWLGGYNFQWAWASAAACARSLV